MSKPVYSAPATAAYREWSGESDALTVAVFAAAGGGYVYTYVDGYDDPGHFAASGGATPYVTVEAAVAAANAVGGFGGDPNAVDPAGPAGDTGEFYGDLA